MRRIAVLVLLSFAFPVAAQTVVESPYTFSLLQTWPTVVVRVQMDPVTCQPPPAVPSAQRVPGGVQVTVRSDQPCNLAPQPPADLQYDLGSFEPGAYRVMFQSCGFGPDGVQCGISRSFPSRSPPEAARRRFPRFRHRQ